MPASRSSRQRWLGAAVRVACAIPLLALALAFVRDDLGANPVEALTHATGEWALRLLLLSLCVTPLRRITGAGWLAPWRRTFGLFAFFYASLHFSIYLFLDLDFDFGFLIEDLRERPYITLGFTSFVLMLPLALTSNRFAIRRLRRRWVSLHRLVYPCAVIAILHFIWLTKADLREPLIHAALLGVLLALRWPALRFSAIGRAGAPDRATDRPG